MKNLYLLLLFCSGIAFSQPVIQQPSDLVVCSGSDSGFETFDLTVTIPEILGALDPSTHTVHFYTTAQFSELGSGYEISNPNNYMMFLEWFSPVYVRVWENSDPDSYSLTSFNLVANPTPQWVWLENMVINENPSDGVAVFNMTTQDAIITNGQSGMIVSYHPTQFDATAGMNQISNANAFTNTSNPQQIWVRVENPTTQCFQIINFYLFVNSSLDPIVFIPDANFKAALIGLGIDLNSDLEIQVSEAVAVNGELDVSDSNIADLTGFLSFVNVNYLDCSNNELTSLQLQGSIPSIFSLNCSNNNLTYLDLGHLNYDYVNCSNNQLTSLSLTNVQGLYELYCQNNALGWISIPPIPGPGMHDLNISNNPIQEFVFPETSNFNFTCNNTALELLDLSHASFNLESVLTITGNPNLHTISFRNGEYDFAGDNPSDPCSSCTFSLTLDDNPSLVLACVDDLEMAGISEADYFMINFPSLTNLTATPYCEFTPGSDFNIVTGTVRFDADNNGCSSSDPVFPWIKFRLTGIDSDNVAFSNIDGMYTFYAQSGDYELMPEFENPNYYDLFTPVMINFPAVDYTVTMQDFCIVANGIHPDAEIVISPVVPANPGFDAIYQISYKNKGNQILNGGFSFTYDESVFDFISTTATPFSQAAGLISWNYSNLMPFESRTVLVSLNLNGPMETPAVNIDDMLTFTASITLNSATDETPADNVYNYEQVVIGSFDPNDKTCVEGEIVSPDEIGEFLHYIINFENTGTAPAQNIVVRDLINPLHFDIESLQVISSSHNVIARQNENLVEFIFQGINLDTGGHGNILLKIKTLSSLVTGDMVSNQANIFFDYNFPIETNFANTTFQSLGLDGHAIDASIVVYPNPSNHLVNVSAKGEIQSLQLFDIQGRLLQTIFVDGQTAQLNIADKSNGIYFLKVISDQGIKIEKLIKK